MRRLTRSLCVHSINVSTGPMEDRLLMTGLHKVKDIYCKQCNENLGWKYVRTYVGACLYLLWETWDGYCA